MEQLNLFDNVEEPEEVWQHYALCDPRYEGPEAVRYIGRCKTKPGQARRRFYGHIRAARDERKDGYHTHRSRWIRKLLREGFKPIQVILGLGNGSRETELIDYWESLGAQLTNHTRGGDGGHKLDEEAQERWIKRCQEARNGPNPRYELARAEGRVGRPRVSAPKCCSKCKAPVTRKTKMGLCKSCRGHGERLCCNRSCTAGGGGTRAKRLSNCSRCAVCNLLYKRHWRRSNPDKAREARQRSYARQHPRHVPSSRLCFNTECTAGPEGGRAHLVDGRSRKCDVCKEIALCKVKEPEKKRGSEHPNSKLNEGRVWYIRNRYAVGGVSQRSFVRLFGVDKKVVRAVLDVKAWSHVEN